MTVDEALRILRNLWGHTERRRQCAADAMAGHIDAMNRHIKGQAAQIEALTKDAERYRWLRDTGDATWRPFGLRMGYSAAQADAEIDSAIKAKETKR